MTEQLGRRAILEYDGKRWEGLRMAFDAGKSGKQDKATVKVWGLAQDSRKRFAQNEDKKVRLYAGYGEDIQLLFSGDLSKANSVSNGPEWVTSLELGDGEKSRQDDRVSASFKPGTAFKKILKEVVDSFKNVDAVEAGKKILSGDVSGGVDTLFAGVSLLGNSHDILEEELKKVGYSFVIQDGILLLVKDGGVVPRAFIPEISSASGMIGSPEVGEKGRVKVVNLLAPNIRPKHRVKLVSRHLSGEYRVENIQHKGDTDATEWYSTMELSPYAP